MTSYTLRLKDVIELYSGDEAQATGLDRYPIYDEAHRPVLNEKIIQTYWNEEIAHETDSLFRQSMRARMLLIMDTYNKLYESEALEYDPLLSIDMTTETDAQSHTESSGQSNSENTSESSGTGAARNFTFPQQQIGVDGAYATTGSESTSGSTGTGSSTDTNTGTQDGTTSGTTHQHGRGQSAQSLIAEFRNNILNIDMMIVDDLSVMFMDTWTTGQAFMAQESSLYRPYYRGW